MFNLVSQKNFVKLLAKTTTINSKTKTQFSVNFGFTEKFSQITLKLLLLIHRQNYKNTIFCQIKSMFIWFHREVHRLELKSHSDSRSFTKKIFKSCAVSNSSK